ncbi:MAG: bifunctional glutamate N-acetyltransferase/amino-acid acetyltransferase ArgJ [SAR324 cluster bacterium]|nr:bifunctional glutamate N-acetyltransferase/amino-acid acetyltransferase ArgJ [SAR324 cluster bacterium]
MESTSDTKTQAKLPSGFLYSGVTAGIKESGNSDLALISCPNGGRAGGAFTQNKFPATSVLYDKALCPLEDFRAMVVNSGNANAATGAQGEANNLSMAAAVAGELKCAAELVLTGSTGIIGQQLPIEKITRAIPQLVTSLQADPTPASVAILTTDLTPKVAQGSIDFAGNQYQTYGMTKGSGMIHPNMATMLGYVMTDAPLPKDINQLTKDLAEKSFNCISVDGDTSTNDSFFVITSNKEFCPPEFESLLFDSLLQVSQDLAKQIAADGEGAKHLIHLEISEAKDMVQAQDVLKAVLTSPLVKTAIHGQDPNWGRLMMAVGNGLSGEVSNPPISISICGVDVFKSGEPMTFDAKDLSTKMAAFDVVITVALAQGTTSLLGWGCDLSREYITINADYTT